MGRRNFRFRVWSWKAKVCQALWGRSVGPKVCRSEGLHTEARGLDTEGLSIRRFRYRRFGDPNALSIRRFGDPSFVSHLPHCRIYHIHWFTHCCRSVELLPMPLVLLIVVDPKPSAGNANRQTRHACTNSRNPTKRNEYVHKGLGMMDNAGQATFFLRFHWARAGFWRMSC